jgi:lambda family phage portal protein
MNLFRKIIKLIGFGSSPAARYEGATHSWDRGWIPASIQDARFDADKATRSELVRKSRYFEKNNAIYNRLADLFCNYTAGAGLQIMPASIDPQWNASAKASWEAWCQQPNLTNRQSFAALINTIARAWFVDGECFIVKTRGQSGRPRVQLFESHRVETPPQHQDQEGEGIIDGIMIDANGRPIGYYFCTVNKDGAGKTYELVSADNVVHLFDPLRPGQYRGLPFVSSVINDLIDLDELQLLEMRAAKDAADITNVIKTPSGEVDPHDFRRRSITETKTDSNGNTYTETKLDYYKDSIGGNTLVMKDGDDIQQFRSDRPSVATSGYWKYLTEKICAGVGIPYVLVFPDSMQGTVYRGALDMANQFFRARFVTLSDVAREIFAFVMDYSRLTERNLRDAPYNWRAVNIHPPRAVNVDVGRNSAAMLAELEAGATTYDQIYGPLGLDWKEQFRSLKAQRDFAAEIGLSIGVGANSAVSDDTHDTNPDLKALFDAYGIGVRSGAITPTLEDEAHFRAMAKLPSVTPEAQIAWDREGKVRRPITLVQPHEKEQSLAKASGEETDIQEDKEHEQMV